MEFFQGKVWMLLARGVGKVGRGARVCISSWRNKSPSAVNAYPPKGAYKNLWGILDRVFELQHLSIFGGVCDSRENRF